MTEPAPHLRGSGTRTEAAALRIETDRVVCSVFARESLTGLPPAGAEDRRAAEIAFLAGRFDLDPKRIFALRQTHGIESHRIGPSALDADRPEPGVFAEGDALYTAEREVLLVVRTADCLPVFFIMRDADYEPFAVGLIHAGWRGLADGVIEATLRKACEAYGAPARLEVRIGPAIGGKVYEVGPEVAERFPIITPRPGRVDKFWLDLAANAEARLIAWQNAGRIPVDILGDLRACTYTDNTSYFSHRRGDPQRNLNCIILRGTD